MLRLIIFTICILFSSCAEEHDITVSDISFGSENSLDIITWNIENFPKSDLTIDYVTNFISAIHDIDIIALQEISDQSSFNILVNSLNNENWLGFRDSNSNYGELSYLINTKNVTIIDSPYLILESL